MNRQASMSIVACALAAALIPGPAAAQAQPERTGSPPPKTESQPAAGAPAPKSDAPAGAAAQATDLTDAIGGGKLLLELRPRYEYVDQANKPDTANAFTLRTLLGWQTKPWHGFVGLVQFLNVANLDGDEYNPNPAVTTSRYPTVADPNNTDVPQLYLDYVGFDKTSIKWGRQISKLNNLRVVGDVNFRQTPQTFDAISAGTTFLPNANLYGAYYWRQLTTLGTQKEMQTPVLNARYSFLPNEYVIGYAVFQDQANTGQNTGFSDNSNQILGIRLDGAHPFGEKWKGLYTAEYAKQDPYADGNAAIDTYYYHLALGAQYGPYYGRVHQERLASNDGLYGYQTPLATLHIFQGWADQFTTTPRQGLIDTYLSGGATLFGKLQIYGEYHWFDSDVGGIDLGAELDLSVSYPLYKGLVGKLEYADYRTGDPPSATGKSDTTKFWVTLTYSY
jgi:hypothetical protein